MRPGEEQVGDPSPQGLPALCVSTRGTLGLGTPMHSEAPGSESELDPRRNFPQMGPPERAVGQHTVSELPVTRVCKPGPTVGGAFLHQR